MFFLRCHGLQRFYGSYIHEFVAVRRRCIPNFSFDYFGDIQSCSFMEHEMNQLRWSPQLKFIPTQGDLACSHTCSLILKSWILITTAICDHFYPPAKAIHAFNMAVTLACLLHAQCCSASLIICLPAVNIQHQAVNRNDQNRTKSYS